MHLQITFPHPTPQSPNLRIKMDFFQHALLLSGLNVCDTYPGVAPGVHINSVGKKGAETVTFGHANLFDNKKGVEMKTMHGKACLFTAL